MSRLSPPRQTSPGGSADVEHVSYTVYTLQVVLTKLISETNFAGYLLRAGCRYTGEVEWAAPLRTLTPNNLIYSQLIDVAHAPRVAGADDERLHQRGCGRQQVGDTCQQAEDTGQHAVGRRERIYRRRLPGAEPTNRRAGRHWSGRSRNGLKPRRWPQSPSVDRAANRLRRPASHGRWSRRQVVSHSCIAFAFTPLQWLAFAAQQP